MFEIFNTASLSAEPVPKFKSFSLITISETPTSPCFKVKFEVNSSISILFPIEEYDASNLTTFNP